MELKNTKHFSSTSNAYEFKIENITVIMQYSNVKINVIVL